mmetsp:Transcript_12492/g.18201  ORF Transcript_12492/g.18201 Transcript_12492/m.18201 type:complete len:440 (+) Transcript_12492:38-1357(+)
MKEDGLQLPVIGGERTPYTAMESQASNSKPDYPDFMTLFLTVISSFFYMGNFYLLAVTAKDYSDALGVEEGFSGILTGVNWTAAVLCAFCYSFWSNYQFKVPTAFCAGLVFLGNLLYFLAYDANSSLVLVLGRLLIGIGGPRVINRRYIATYVSLSARTKWNTAYVAGSILGMGCGPFASAGLYYFQGSLFGLSITSFNSCALVMTVVWLAYFVSITLLFKEPEIYNKAGSKPLIDKETGSYSSIPTIMALWALFFPKLLQESLIISSPIVTGTLFGWSSEFLGIYLAITLLAVSPIHILIAYTSKYVQDRQFLLIAFFFCVLGSFLLIGYGDLPVWQYVVGSVVVHLAINLSDGVSTSLTSKVLPPEIGRGFFNPGLLSTFAGSSGRAFGSSLIFVCGYLGTNQTMENSLFVPIGLLSVVSLLVFMASYKNLVPLKKD